MTVKAIAPFTWPPSVQSAAEDGRWAAVQGVRGTETKPYPARGLRTTSGTQKVTLIWDVPVKNANQIAQWRIYMDTEINQIAVVKDPTVTTYDVQVKDTLVHNFFVVGVDALGKKSTFANVTAAATGITLDSVSDGPVTYAKTLGVRVNAGRPLIDFSEGIHSNKNLDNVGDGPTFGRLRLTALTGNNLDPAKAGVLANGGTPPFNATGFTYSATTNSITWTWTSLTIYRADGTTTVISGSQTITGLTNATTYYFYPYYDDLAGAIGWVICAHGAPAYAALSGERTYVLAQSQSLQSRIPLSSGPMSALVGGGGGGGGGGNQCVRETMLVEEKTRGVIPATEVRAGVWLRSRLAPEGWTRVIWADSVAHEDFIRVLVNGRAVEVVPTHPFYAMDEDCNPIDCVRAAEASLSHQLYTRHGAGFIEGLLKIKVPGARKRRIKCSPTDSFLAGETEPYIETHNYYGS